MIPTVLAVVGAGVASFVVLAALFVPLERAFPARAAQRILRTGFSLDACFFVGQYLVFGAVALSVIASIGAVVGDAVPPALRAWTATRPAWAQVIGALALGDFAVYWFHRACHRFEWLWRFHEVHHSAEHLDWLAAHREHPLDGLVTQLCMNLPAIALGVRLELLAGVAIFRGAWAIFVHSNTRIPLGPLRWLLGAPELHHWHHARMQTHDARTVHNFANLAPWLDVAFGTYHCPDLRSGERGERGERGEEERYALGLSSEAQASRAGYLGHLVGPLLPRRLLARARQRPYFARS